MAKEEAKKVVKNEKADVAKVSKVTKKPSSNKKDVEKKTKTTAKKNPVEKEVSTKTKKEPVAKTSAKKTTSKTASSKKAPTKATKSVKTSSKKKIVNESTAKSMLTEYYDLPYRYNQTIVRILAQTPTTLFVYWDISDEDRTALMNKYGENFFYESRPILVVHNTTHNYTFEIEINDFANSWYIRTQEPNCDYVIELGRRLHNNHQEYIYINSSNGIISPNDHILFESSDLGHVQFRNVKTNVLSSKDFGSLRFINDIDKLYGNIYDVYSALYNDNILDDLSNPSSGGFRLEK